jgi:hypothetical protein
MLVFLQGSRHLLHESVLHHLHLQAPPHEDAEECLTLLGQRFPHLQELHLTSQTPLVEASRIVGHAAAISSFGSVFAPNDHMPNFSPLTESLVKWSAAAAHPTLPLNNLTKLTWKGEEELPLIEQLRHAAGWLQWLPAISSISSLDLSGASTVPCLRTWTFEVPFEHLSTLHNCCVWIKTNMHIR